MLIDEAVKGYIDKNDAVVPMAHISTIHLIKSLWDFVFRCLPSIYNNIIKCQCADNKLKCMGL